MIKFATIASICLAATTAPRQFTDGAPFDALMSLVDQLQDEAMALSGKYGGMDAEITSLIDQLTKCEGGGGEGEDGGGITPDSTTSGGGDSNEDSDEYGGDDGGGRGGGGRGGGGGGGRGGGPYGDDSSSSGSSGDDGGDMTPYPVGDDGNDDGYDDGCIDDDYSSTHDDSPHDDGTGDDDNSNNDGGNDSGSGGEEDDDVDDGGDGGGGGGDNGGGGGGGGSFKFHAGQSWNYNLATPVDTNVNVDVFFIDMDGAQATIDTLHGKGKGVVCYISIGTVEDWRDDAGQFPSAAIGGGVEGWAGEQWLDVKDMTVREIMATRVEKAASMNCDAIEPDNMMVYSEPGTGINVSEEEQIEYNTWFAGVVHSHGMAVGLKNAVELVPILVGDFDFALNEECHEWDECDKYKNTFLAENKPVFNVEYNLGLSVCDSSNKLGLDTIVKDYDLDASLCSCVDNSRDVGCKHRL